MTPLTGYHQCPTCWTDVPNTRRWCFFCAKKKSRKILTMTDPELGPMRFCRACDEYWPLDEEFWTTNSSGRWVCVACKQTWNRVNHAKKRAAA